MSVTCFWLEPTDRCRYALRRYVSGGTCLGKYGYHNAQEPLGETATVWKDNDGHKSYSVDLKVEDFANDPRWPTKCAYCDYEFCDADSRQIFFDLLYHRPDTGEEMTLRDAPPGAMWNAWWLPDAYQGFDGRALTVKCPDGHEWLIDGRASNCALPDDREHRCWLREGEPPKITVGKAGVGRTCGAGGGSIQTPGSYHGFLTNGVFT